MDSTTVTQTAQGRQATYILPLGATSIGATSVPEKKTRLGSACESQWGFFFPRQQKNNCLSISTPGQGHQAIRLDEAAFNQVSLASRCLAWASLVAASDAGLAFKV